MYKHDVGDAIVTIIICFLIFVVSGTSGYTMGKRKIQREAIQNGVAEYVISDQESGATEFKWKAQK